MANNLVQIIFEQFLEIVQQFSKKACFCFNECDFDYRVRELANHRLLDVIYVVQDNCGRRRDVIITIDITNICLDSLISCKWVNYLETLAREFISNICPKKFIVMKHETRKCRPQPPKWQPFPCRNITVIRKKRPCLPPPEIEVIVEKPNRCIPQCIREPCIPKQEITIIYEPEVRPKCGEATFLVNEPKQKRHDWNVHKGTTDFNDHIWRPCCGRDQILIPGV